MKTRKLARWVMPAAAAFAWSAVPAQEVVLKVEHFLGPNSTAQQQLLGPWCEKIGKESGGRLKCQIYPAMQLGGTPPQLFDQAKDGVVDVVWTIPTYQAGRFVKSEVFELPYLIKSAETGSPALWEYVQKNSLDEFKGTKLILTHVHDGAQLHFTEKTVKTLEDLKGLKVRAPDADRDQGAGGARCRAGADAGAAGARGDVEGCGRRRVAAMGGGAGVEDRRDCEDAHRLAPGPADDVEHDLRRRDEPGEVRQPSP